MSPSKFKTFSLQEHLYGVQLETEFNFKTRIELTDPTLKQPVIDNAKAMNQIATRWVDQNINVI